MQQVIRRRHDASRRGAALLVALATLILAVTATATFVRVAGTISVQRRFDRDAHLCGNLLGGAEGAILAWLSEDAGTVVLPPDSTAPVFPVLHDRIVIEDKEAEITITAWDQLAMVSVEALPAGSPLRSTVPADVLRLVDRLDEQPDRLGLDVFEAPLDGRQHRVQVYPQPVTTEAMLFDVNDDRGRSTGSKSPSASNPADTIALGAVLATHNEPLRINVHTAPIDLVEAALREAGRGGIELVLAARQAGEPVALGSLPRIVDPLEHAPTLVSSSDAWAFRIDIRVNRVESSWWAIYALGRVQRDQLIPSPWKCVQRLAIRE
jgi:hypothetical protein